MLQRLLLQIHDALGEVQVVLYERLCKKPIILANTLRLNINSIKEYTSSPKRRIGREIEAKKEGNREVKFIVKRCASSPYMHKYIVENHMS